MTAKIPKAKTLLSKDLLPGMLVECMEDQEFNLTGYPQVKKGMKAWLQGVGSEGDVKDYRKPNEFGYYPTYRARYISGIFHAPTSTRPSFSETYIEPTTKWKSIKTGASAQAFAKAIKHVVDTNAQRVIAHGKGYYVGSDPEVFALRADGEVLPAFEFLPSKQKATTDINGITAHWDGYQAEFCMEPQLCHGYFTDRIQYGLKAVFKAAQKVDPKATLTWRSVVEIPEKLRIDAPQEHVQLGCAPSVNIYEEFRPPIETARCLPWRFAGMHMHYGLLGISKDVYPNACYKDLKYQWTPERLFNAINAADHIGAVCVTAMLEGMEHPMRRQYYGRPGEYRVDRYRLEYRTLSSAILAHPAILMFAIDMTRQAIRIGDTGLLPLLWKAKDDEMREAVINVDAKACRKILIRNENVVKKLIGLIYTSECIDFAWDLLMHGVKESMSISDNMMIKAWRLDPPPDAVNKYGEPNRRLVWSAHSETDDGHFAYLQRAIKTQGKDLALVQA